MLNARIPAHDGTPERIVAADDPAFEKADFYTMAARGLLQCSGHGRNGQKCCAPVTHVSGGFVDGGISERVSHFRINDAESHTAGCEHIDDPRNAQRTASIRQALDRGLPILINVNIAHMGVKNGRKLLSPEFNASVNNPESGLWTKAVWLREKAKHHQIAENEIVRVPARDITDVLYYLELAKQHGIARGGETGGQEAMRQLWFNTGHAVQSSARFVVADSNKKVTSLVREFMARATATPKRSDELCDTPRLFLFTVSQKQIEKAQKEAAQQLYGQHKDIVISPDGKPVVEQHVIMAMRMKADDMDNRRVVGVGHKLWVAAVPTFSRRRAFEMREKGAGRTSGYLKPGYIFLQVANMEQMVAEDAPRRKAQPPRGPKATQPA